MLAQSQCAKPGKHSGPCSHNGHNSDRPGGAVRSLPAPLCGIRHPYTTCSSDVGAQQGSSSAQMGLDSTICCCCCCCPLPAADLLASCGLFCRLRNTHTCVLLGILAFPPFWLLQLHHPVSMGICSSKEAAGTKGTPVGSPTPPEHASEKVEQAAAGASGAAAAADGGRASRADSQEFPKTPTSPPRNSAADGGTPEVSPLSCRRLAQTPAGPAHGVVLLYDGRRLQLPGVAEGGRVFSER